MIPRKIHYCYFNPQKMSDSVIRSISSWKAYMPDYQLVMWNEYNTPLFLPWIRQFIQNHQWLELYTLIKYHALFTEGGIFLSTSIEVIKNFDPLLTNDAFLGFQSINETSEWLGTKIIGVKPHNGFIKQILDLTEQEIVDNDASKHTSINITSSLKDKGLNKYGLQKIEDLTLYPIEYFYPYEWNRSTPSGKITNETYCINHQDTDFSGQEFWYKSFLQKLKDKLTSLANDPT
ncbi:MAG TPA: glycosyltransferase [Balneolales bacterium]|nr:glycosyltransferase [Balneolales bacterium]